MVNTGYKAMLRDRVPLVVNLALLWNNSKTAWVDHVYKNFISIYASKLERDNATRIVLGIKRGNKGFDFHKTIDWNNLSSESNSSKVNIYETKKHWMFVERWVDWFTTNYAYIENAYVTFITSGHDKNETKEKIKREYLDFLEDWEQEDMMNLLIEHFDI